MPIAEAESGARTAGAETNKIPIAAMVRRFCEVSESWLYRQLLGLRRYGPEVLANERTNETVFPYERVHVVMKGRDVWSRVRSEIYRLASGRKYRFPPEVLRGFTRICRARGIRLIHAHSGWMGAQSLDLAEQTNLPLVVSFYGGDVTLAPNRTLYYRRLPELFERADLFLPLSRFLADRIKQMGCDPGKIRVQQVGVPPNSMSVRSHSDHGGPTRFISVGRLVEFKDPCTVLRAFARFLQDGGKGTLTLIGDGPLRKESGRTVRELELTDSVELVGARPFPFVRDALAKADVYVHAGRVAHDGGVETLGVSILEASATCLPVVSVEIGGIPEAVVADETGFLVRPGDHEAMAERMLQLGRDARLRARLGAAGRSHVERNFDCAELNARLETIYDEVLAGGS